MSAIIDKIEFTLGGYVRSVVMIGIVIGFINFVILFIIALELYLLVLHV